MSSRGRERRRRCLACRRAEGTGHILTAETYSPSLATSLLAVAMLMVTTGSRAAQPGPTTGALVLFVTAVACLAHLLHRHPVGPWRLASAPTRPGHAQVLTVGLALHLAMQAGYVIGRADGGHVGWVALTFFTIFAFATLDGIRVRPLLGGWAGMLTALAFLLFGLAWIRVVDTPTVDVPVWQEVGLDRLLAGVDPYVRGYPNIYAADTVTRF